LELVFLGTSSSRPTPKRNTSSTAIRYDEVFLFDCGESTQQRLWKADFSAPQIRKIFLTHLHADHILGLPSVLLDLTYQRPKDKKPVEVYGPVGTRRYLRTVFGLTASQFNFPVYELLEDINDPISGKGYIRKNAQGFYNLVQTNTYSILAAPIKHSVPCFAYVFIEKDRIGTLNVEKANELGVFTIEEFKRLKAGIPVKGKNGNIVTPEQVTGPKFIGRKIAILGDTYDPSPASCILRGVDVLVHESTLANKHSNEVLEKGHSTAGMAGAFAKSVGAKNLILTHFSPRYDTFELVNLVVEAAEAFGNTSVVAANDHDCFEVLRVDEDGQIGRRTLNPGTKGSESKVQLNEEKDEQSTPKQDKVMEEKLAKVEETITKNKKSTKNGGKAAKSAESVPKNTSEKSHGEKSHGEKNNNAKEKSWQKEKAHKPKVKKEVQQKDGEDVNQKSQMDQKLALAEMDQKLAEMNQKLEAELIQKSELNQTLEQEMEPVLTEMHQNLEAEFNGELEAELKGELNPEMEQELAELNQKLEAELIQKSELNAQLNSEMEQKLAELNQKLEAEFNQKSEIRRLESEPEQKSEIIINLSPVVN